MTAAPFHQQMYVTYLNLSEEIFLVMPSKASGGGFVKITSSAFICHLHDLHFLRALPFLVMVVSVPTFP